MKKKDFKWVAKPTSEKPKKPSIGERVRGDKSRRIGDSDESMERLRKAMEIPPKTNTTEDKK